MQAVYMANCMKDRLFPGTIVQLPMNNSSQFLSQINRLLVSFHRLNDGSLAQRSRRSHGPSLGTLRRYRIFLAKLPPLPNTSRAAILQLDRQGKHGEYLRSGWQLQGIDL